MGDIERRIFVSLLCYVVDVSSVPESKRYEYYQAIERGSSVISPFDPRIIEFEVYYDEKSSVTAPPALPACKARQVK